MTLSATMIILGVSVLGDLNRKATSQESLGLAFWRIVASAGILAMVMGLINFPVVRHPASFTGRLILTILSRVSFLGIRNAVSLHARSDHTEPLLPKSSIAKAARGRFSCA